MTGTGDDSGSKGAGLVTTQHAAEANIVGIETASRIKPYPLDLDQRTAIVGKTGSGKTSFAVVLATLMVPIHTGDWQVHWIDTKGDPKDIQRLKEYGFIHEQNWKRDVPKVYKRWNRIYWPIRDNPKASTMTQVQALFGHFLRLAAKRSSGKAKVVVVVDEYLHAVPSRVSAGRNLEDAFKTGRGRGIGIIGLTQEPVNCPRLLMSQAGHMYLFNLHFPLDIKKVQEWFKGYEIPSLRGDRYGFWHSYLDGPPGWAYYRDQRNWHEAAPYRRVEPEEGV